MVFDLDDNFKNFKRTIKDSIESDYEEEKEERLQDYSMSNCNIMPGAAHYIHKLKQKKLI